MDGDLYTRLHSSRELRCPAGRLGLCPHHPQKTLHHHSPPGFPHPDQPDSGMFVQRDQTAAHQVPIGGRRGPPISKLLKKFPNNQPKLLTCRTEPQEPALEVHRVCPPWYGPSRESPRNRCHRILGDVHRSELRWSARVRFQTH